MSLPRPCTEPGCPTPATNGPRCPQHANPRPHRSRTDRVRARLLREQPWCSYCGAPETPDNRLTIDHRIPLSHGGDNRLENLAVACWRCNRSKADAVTEVPPAGPAGPAVVIG